MNFGKDYYYIEKKQYNDNSKTTINKWTIDVKDNDWRTINYQEINK